MPRELVNTISFVGHLLEQRMDEALRSVGLTARLYQALAHIADAPGLSRGALGRLLSVSPQAAGGISLRLRDGGLIDYDKAAGPGLSVSFTVTEPGRQRLQQASSIVAATDRQILAGLAEVTVEMVAEAMRSLALDADQHHPVSRSARSCASEPPADRRPWPATVGVDEMGSPLGWTWMRVTDDGDEAVLVIAADGLGADHGQDLWATVEKALERAAGRPVAVDLRSVTAFGEGSVDVLVNLARAAKRRHVEVCALVLPNTPLHDRIQDRHAVGTLSVYSSLTEALAGLQGQSPHDAHESPARRRHGGTGRPTSTVDGGISM